MRRRKCVCIKRNASQKAQCDAENAMRRRNCVRRKTRRKKEEESEGRREKNSESLLRVYYMYFTLLHNTWRLSASNIYGLVGNYLCNCLTIGVHPSVFLRCPHVPQFAFTPPGGWTKSTHNVVYMFLQSVLWNHKRRIVKDTKSYYWDRSLTLST